MRTNLDGQRRDVERRADLLRDRLGRTLEEIDRRRHDLFDVQLQVRRHAGAVALAGGVLALAVTGGVALALHRSRTQPQRLRRARLRALTRLWQHPDWLARRGAPERPVWAEIGRRVVVSTATMLATRIAKRLLGGVAPPARSRAPTALLTS